MCTAVTEALLLTALQMTNEYKVLLLVHGNEEHFEAAPQIQFGSSFVEFKMNSISIKQL